MTSRRGRRRIADARPRAPTLKEKAVASSLFSRLRALTAAAVLSLALPHAPASAADVTTPIVSGLTWRSGADGDYDLAGWRGRPLDIRVVFVAHKTWQMMFDKTSNPYFSK